MVPQKLTFSPLSRRQIEAYFSGGHITSDAGLLLLREVDKQHGLTQRLAKTLTDQRDSSMIRQQLGTMVRQRAYGLANGYEDLNDHEALRRDQALRTAKHGLRNLAPPCLPILAFWMLAPVSSRTVSIAATRSMSHRISASTKVSRGARWLRACRGNSGTPAALIWSAISRPFPGRTPASIPSSAVRC